MIEDKIKLGYAEFLVDCGIESLSVTPDAVVKTLLHVIDTEKKLKILPKKAVKKKTVKKKSTKKKTAKKTVKKKSVKKKTTKKTKKKKTKKKTK